MWEEDEFWIERLSWRSIRTRIDGIRRYFESPYQSGEKIRIDEYYRWIFEEQRSRSSTGRRQRSGVTPLDYMRKYGAFLVENNVYELHRKVLKPEEVQGLAG